MPRRRLELPRHRCHRYLKPARLPIPPSGPIRLHHAMLALVPMGETKESQGVSSFGKEKRSSHALPASVASIFSEKIFVEEAIPSCSLKKEGSRRVKEAGDRSFSSVESNRNVSTDLIFSFVIPNN